MKTFHYWNDISISIYFQVSHNLMRKIIIVLFKSKISFFFSKENFKTSRPVIRPLWMLDSNDPVNHVIDNEFMIGDEVLVAPILQYKQRSRNIYLPNIPDAKDANGNMWRGSDGRLYEGGRWLNNTLVGLEDVPYFVRLSDDPLA